jgi:hypothetical protein
MVILPISEVRFACILLLNGPRAKKNSPPSTLPQAETNPLPEDGHLEDEVSAEATMPEQKGAGDFTPPTNEEGSGLAVDAGKESAGVAGPRTKWKLRSGIKVLVVAVSSILRLCIVPVWLSILSVELLFAIVLYGVLALLLKSNPLDTRVRQLKASELFTFNSRSSGAEGAVVTPSGRAPGDNA